MSREVPTKGRVVFGAFTAVAAFVETPRARGVDRGRAASDGSKPRGARDVVSIPRYLLPA